MKYLFFIKTNRLHYLTSYNAHKSILTLQIMTLSNKSLQGKYGANKAAERRDFGVFRKKCNHEYVLIGDCYKERLTEYRNCFDKVVVFRKFKCKKCGEFYNELLSTEEFEPQLYHGREKRKDDYILKLINMGFKQEIELLKERDNH